MIKKSLITSALIIIAFSVFLFLNKTEWKSIQYQYQSNLIKTQKYLYNKSAPEGVIVGTSLSARLLNDSMPGIYNLSLPGLNVFDGLYIISEKKVKPSVVFIEINYFLRAENKEYINTFNSKLSNIIKEDMPALREENQPAGIVMHYVKAALKPAASGTTATHIKRTVSDDVFTELLNNQIKEYKKTDTTLMRHSSEKLYKYVKDLTAAGIKVCFFEMPVNPALEDLPLARAVRIAINEQFHAENNVFFIAKPADGPYETMDGVHLDDDGVYNYTMYMKDAMHRLSLVFRKS